SRETKGTRAPAVRREPTSPSRTAGPVPGRAGGYLRSAPHRDQPTGAPQALPALGDDRSARARPRTSLRGRPAQGRRLIVQPTRFLGQADAGTRTPDPHIERGGSRLPPRA